MLLSFLTSKTFIMRTKHFFFAKISFAGFAILCIMASCKKEKNDTCPTTVAAISGTYKLTALKYKPASESPEQDYLILREDCEKDDLIDLQANGIYTYRDAGITCSPDGTNSGTWSVAGNTIISDGVVSGTIQRFDCRDLVLYSDNFIIPGDRLTLTIEKQ
jgi:hypothetical protein